MGVAPGPISASRNGGATCFYYNWGAAGPSSGVGAPDGGCEEDHLRPRHPVALASVWQSFAEVGISEFLVSFAGGRDLELLATF